MSKPTKREIYKRFCYKDKILDLIIECHKYDMLKSDFLYPKQKRIDLIIDVLKEIKNGGNGFKNLIKNEYYPEGDYKTVCSFCKKEIAEEDFDIAFGYWRPFWRSVHKNCKQEQENNEQYECQKIDANCNDCKYFKRDIPSEKVDIPKGNECRSVLPPLKGYKGFCGKNKGIVYASPKIATSNNCFVHRKEEKYKDKYPHWFKKL